MIWIIIALSLLVGAADLRFYLRHIARHTRGLRFAFAVWAFATNLLPFFTMGVFFLMRDNTTTWTHMAMWAFFIYLFTVLPRLAFYFFQHFRLRRTGIIAGIAVMALLVWGVAYARTAITVSEVEIRSEKLPEAFDGVRIVQFSDLHIGTLLHPEREMKRLVDKINSLHPDLVVFSGDLINIRYTELDSTAMRILSGIRAPLGVVSNLGNHDVGVYVHDTLALPVAENTARLIERQRAMGWRLPDNETEYLIRGSDTISISGISFDPAFRKQRHDRTIDVDLTNTYKDVPQYLYNITISHLPQLWEQILESGYGDLTLAGHVHAMQMSLNVGKCRLSPARLIYKRWTGHYQIGARSLYINDGIGYVGFPMRLGAYPEITVFTLRR